MNSSTIAILATIVIYIVGLLVIGFRYAKRNGTSAEFYLGGRKLGPLVTAMSAEASDMSSYLLMGLPGLAYLSGLADVGWTCIGLAVGTYLNWLFTAKRLRRYTYATKSFTLPQFFSNRFRDKHNVLSLFAALFIIVFFVPYTASGFAACGKLFSSLFGVNYMTAMIVSAVIIVLYTTAGGFLAASVTDFIQSILMTIAILSVLIFATVKAGGIGVVAENIKSFPGFVSLVQTYNDGTGTASPYTFLTIIATLSWGLGYFGMPHILLRFMAIENEEKLKVSRRVASIWVVIAMGLAVVIGFVGRAMSSFGIVEKLDGNSSENIIVKISDLLASYGVFPAILAGIVLSGILACTMSTSDSQLLAASSSVSEDILKNTLHLKITDKGSMIIARITVIVISVLGVFIAQNPDSSVFKIVSFAWAGFGGAFGPLVICALFWKRTNFPGALCGMISGGVMVFVWKFLIKPLGGIFNLYELLPAFLVGILVTVIVSLCTAKPSKEITDEFELVRSGKQLN